MAETWGKATSRPGICFVTRGPPARPTRPRIISPGAKISDAIKLMLKHRISGLPVVDRKGRPVGILTEFKEATPLHEVAHQMEHRNIKAPASLPA
jgi:hypothetical protein